MVDEAMEKQPKSDSSDRSDEKIVANFDHQDHPEGPTTTGVTVNSTDHHFALMEDDI